MTLTRPISLSLADVTGRWQIVTIQDAEFYNFDTFRMLVNNISVANFIYFLEMDHNLTKIRRLNIEHDRVGLLVS